MTTAKFPSPSPQKPIGAGLTDWSIQSRASVGVSNAVTGCNCSSASRNAADELRCVPYSGWASPRTDECAADDLRLAPSSEHAEVEHETNCNPGRDRDGDDEPDVASLGLGRDGGGGAGCGGGCVHESHSLS
jgi:hypothetical protein